jgi:hypothetical protein
MVDLTISGEVAEKLREIARQENRPVEEVLETMVERYQPTDVPTGPADEDIEVPPDIEDVEGYRAAVRQIRPKLYRMARRYWERVGDKERLAMTDAELDKQFWLIDHEGIPRFKSEKDQVQLPPDPLEAIVGLFADSEITDMSTTVRETIAEYWGKKAQEYSEHHDYPESE